MSGGYEGIVHDRGEHGGQCVERGNNRGRCRERSARGVCAILLGDDPEALLRDLQDRFPRARLLGDAGITAHVMDRNMSALEGSVGMLPRRLLVVDEDLDAALRIVREAGLGQWIVQS